MINNNYLQLLCREIVDFLLYRGFPRPNWSRGQVKIPEKIVVRNFIASWNTKKMMVQKSAIFK